MSSSDSNWMDRYPLDSCPTRISNIVHANSYGNTPKRKIQHTTSNLERRAYSMSAVMEELKISKKFFNFSHIDLFGKKYNSNNGLTTIQYNKIISHIKSNKSTLLTKFNEWCKVVS